MFFDAHSDIWTDVTIRRMAGERQVLERRHLPRLRRDPFFLRPAGEGALTWWAGWIPKAAHASW